MEYQVCKTPLEDLRQDKLKHYEEASTKINNWYSGIPIAINFYYDYKSLSFLGKIRLAFKS